MAIGRRRTWPTLLAVVVSASFVLSGCTTRAVLEAAALTETERDGYAAHQREEDWTAVLARFPSAERPEVEPVRFMEPLWIGVTIAGCLANAGFPSATYSPDGGVSPGPDEPARAEELAVATYVCAATYPASPDEQSRLGAAEIERLYAYFTERLIPCLAAAGRVVDDIPTSEEFDLRLRFGPIWSPYSALGALPAAERTQLAVRCPLYPEGFRERHPGFFLY